MALAQYKTAALALTGIQHLWMLDELSGTTAADSQGSTPLTYGADVSGFLTTGPDGAAQVPVNNGTANRVAINSTGFAPSADGTYFWWQRYDTSENNDGMTFEFANSPTFNSYIQGDYNYSGGGETAGKALFAAAYANPPFAASCYFDRQTTGVWDFLCLVIDTSLTATLQARVYKNGTLVSTPSVSTGSQNGRTPGTMKIGVLGRNNNGTRALPIKAAMCGFGLTNTVLSTTEMTSLRSAMLSAMAMPIAPAPLRALIGR